MNDRERILNLLKDGRITSDEAALLMDALEEADTPRRGFVAPVPPVPPTPPVHSNPKRAVLEDDRPQGLRWVKAHLSSNSLSVRLDDSLEKPLLRGDLLELSIKEEGTDILIGDRQERRGKGSTKVLGVNISWDFDSDVDEPELVLPIGWGLDATLQSGDLQAHGIEYVRGEIMSGDVSLEGVDRASLNVYSGDVRAEAVGLLSGAVFSGDVSLNAVRGVDLEVSSGDLEADLYLTEGHHHLRVMSGDASLRLGDSSVQVEGRVDHGDLHTDHELLRQKRNFKGTLGAGTAQLKINVNSGDLNIA